MNCDGQQPCSRCVDRVLGCTYDTTHENRGSITRSYARLLQARIKLLEEVLQLHSIDIDASVSHLSARNSESLEGPSSAVFTTSLAFNELCSTFEGALCFDETSNFDQDGEARFFGPTSGRLEFKSPSSEQFTPSSDDSAVVQEPTRPRFELALSELSQQTDISEELDEHLINLYFEWEQPWNQVVNERLFRHSRQNGGRFFSPLLLNSILGLGSRYSDRIEVRTDPDDPNTAGRMFLETAEVLLHFDLKWPSITTIQSLAVMAMLYVAVGSDAAGWLHHGMAIRLALDMGLNLDSTVLGGSTRLSAEEVGLRHQIYWSLYCTDKLWASYTGRVCTMLTRGFFDSCLLTLKGWFYDLPPELKLDRRSGAGARSPHVYILNMVYHTSVILLAKPFLSKAARSKVSSFERQQGSVDEFSERAYSLCVEAVAEISQLGDRYRELFGGFHKSPLTATHCTLTAALVTLRLSQEEEESISEEREKLVLSCIQTLQELSDSWTPPRRYWPAVFKMVQERQTKKTEWIKNSIGHGSDTEFLQPLRVDPTDTIDALHDRIATTNQMTEASRGDQAVFGTTLSERTSSDEPLVGPVGDDIQSMSNMSCAPEFQFNLDPDLLPWDNMGFESLSGFNGSWDEAPVWAPL
ncbi:hypothetical protein QQX98_003192 [Neonectria punicea]|uniref:Xylanolytic transcriptional activator regulatory domain-containing protein n=1 Tax=Neonectria punicea TaxID=979145 RepID=A0ABR1HEM7_9HYPO